MKPEDDFFNLERLVFLNGQRLTAADLTAVQETNQEMRWLHNRSLHNWGIGTGMAVSGEKGAREVSVAPGYALDARGREIVLAEAATLPVPPLSGVNGGPAIQDLTISYPADDEVEVSETRAGVCLPGGAVRLSELPRIRWLDPSRVRTGFDLVLARVNIRNCQIDAPLSLIQRRNARPPLQPVVACGHTPQRATVWTPWQDPLFGAGITLGFQTTVDTSGARFHTTPGYQARLAGKRACPVQPEIGLTNPFLVDGFPTVDAPRPDRFTFRVFMPRGQVRRLILNPTTFLDDPDAPKILSETLEWHVVWVGVEG